MFCLSCFRMVLVFLVIFDSFSSGDQGICLSVYDVSNQTIIKSKDSLSNGARFLKAGKATNRKQCEQRCCDTPKCNVAVLQEKPSAADIDSNCYMFNCGTVEDFKCVFSRHDDYVSMGLMVNRDEFEKTRIHEQFKHELDLNILRTKQEKDLYNAQIGAKSSSQSSKSVAATDRSSDQKNGAFGGVDSQNQNPVPNPEPPDRGTAEQTRNANRKQTDPNASGKSTETKPVGQAQKPAQSTDNANPTSACTEFQWQCLSSKECIAIYDVCSGIPQCVDKTDELDYVCSLQDTDLIVAAMQIQLTPAVIPSTTPAYGGYAPTINNNVNNNIGPAYQQVASNSNSIQNQNQYQSNAGNNNYNPQGQLNQQAVPQYNGYNDPNLPYQSAQYGGQNLNNQFAPVSNQFSAGSNNQFYQNNNAAQSRNRPGVNLQPQSTGTPQQQRAYQGGNGDPMLSQRQQQQIFVNQNYPNQQPFNVPNNPRTPVGQPNYVDPNQYQFSVESGRVNPQQQQTAPQMAPQQQKLVLQKPLEKPVLKPALKQVGEVSNGLADAVEKAPSAVIQSDQSVHVAALLLGVGLSLVAILLVFISCRLHRARKRIIRRGKVMDSGEGEHLISGLFA